MLVQPITTNPITENATDATTGHKASQMPSVQLMARVAVGNDNEQRTPTAAMNDPADPSALAAGIDGGA